MRLAYAFATIVGFRRFPAVGIRCARLISIKIQNNRLLLLAKVVGVATVKILYGIDNRWLQPDGRIYTRLAIFFAYSIDWRNEEFDLHIDTAGSSDWMYASGPNAPRNI